MRRRSQEFNDWPIIAWDQLPTGLAAIRELDITQELTKEPFASEWILLGSLSEIDYSDLSVVERASDVQSLLVSPGACKELLRGAGYFGNDLRSLASAGGGSMYRSGKTTYFYTPFFEFSLHGRRAEPLVSRPDATGLQPLFVNPDLLLMLRLEPRGGVTEARWTPDSLACARQRGILPPDSPGGLMPATRARRARFLRFRRPDNQRARLPHSPSQIRLGAANRVGNAM